jgi:hypothetical protein
MLNIYHIMHRQGTGIYLAKSKENQTKLEHNDRSEYELNWLSKW